MGYNGYVQTNVSEGLVMKECKHCKGDKIRKNGTNRGIQRFICNSCGRTFSDRPPKFSKDVKRQAMLMYLNNVGIRKTALFLGTSPTNILNWIKQGHKTLVDLLHRFKPNTSETADVIELDEIYTFVKKNSRGQSFGLLILGEKSVLLRLK
jgi:transposase-like protein